MLMYSQMLMEFLLNLYFVGPCIPGFRKPLRREAGKENTAGDVIISPDASLSPQSQRPMPASGDIGVNSARSPGKWV